MNLRFKNLFLLAALLSTAIAAHAGDPTTGPSTQASCDTGMRAYQQDLWPIQRQNCATCHDDNGIGIAHSSANVATAYGITRTLVTFTDVNTSLIMQKFKQQHWLNYGGKPITLTADDLSAAISKWWTDGESSCPQDSDFSSVAQTIPANLPTRDSNQYVTITWDLGAKEPKLVNCQMAVDIQLFAPAQSHVPASYRLKSPRAGCTDKTLTVKNLWFPVSGEVEGYENEYADSSLVIPATPTLVSISDEESIVIQRNAAGDTLSAQFDPF